jgi:predicted SAM-dependent methyltransferase
MTKAIAALLRGKSGINLDIGCGSNKQDGYVGMDIRRLPGVDIVHNLEDFPYPLPDKCCLNVMASHIVEHIKPWFTIPLFDEIWRITKPGGKFAISTPYAGSFGFWQDPTHCNGFNQATFQYFDPDYPLYGIYKPKPWKIMKGFPMYHIGGNMECLLEKRDG